LFFVYLIFFILLLFQFGMQDQNDIFTAVFVFFSTFLFHFVRASKTFSSLYKTAQYLELLFLQKELEKKETTADFC
jgi:hypothetical protein